MSEQAESKWAINERECVHRGRHAEGSYYNGTTYVQALQRLPASAAMRVAGKVGAFFWSDAGKIKVWLCDECAAEVGL